MNAGIEPTRAPGRISHLALSALRVLPTLMGAAIACALFLAAPSAQAVDGVIEINQASALAGVGIGDTPGFPITLALRGSYRLTGELNVPADTIGILVQNDQISIDLNGFSIVGGGGGGNQGHGIITYVESIRGTRVSNGTVRSMSGHGIHVGADSHVSNVTVIGSGFAGIHVEENGVVADCVAIENGGSGIEGGSDTRVQNSTSSHNGAQGIEVAGGSVTSVLVAENGYNGVRGIGSTIVIDSHARGNGGDGIDVESGLVSGNKISSNTGFAIRFAPGAGGGGGYVNNVMIGNGYEVAHGVALGANTCGGFALCP